MIAEERDASASIAARGEPKAAHPHDAERLEGEIRKARTGLKAEDDAARFNDFAFGRTKSYAVIDDLRPDVDGRVAQIDHLVVSLTLRVSVPETKGFRHGPRIAEGGGFLRRNDWRRSCDAS